MGGKGGGKGGQGKPCPFGSIGLLVLVHKIRIAFVILTTWRSRTSANSFLVVTIIHRTAIFTFLNILALGYLDHCHSGRGNLGARMLNVVIHTLFNYDERYIRMTNTHKRLHDHDDDSCHVCSFCAQQH